MITWSCAFTSLHFPPKKTTVDSHPRTAAAAAATARTVQGCLVSHVHRLQRASTLHRCPEVSKGHLPLWWHSSELVTSLTSIYEGMTNNVGLRCSVGDTTPALCNQHWARQLELVTLNIVFSAAHWDTLDDSLAFEHPKGKIFWSVLITSAMCVHFSRLVDHYEI